MIFLLGILAVIAFVIFSSFIIVWLCILLASSGGILSWIVAYVIAKSVAKGMQRMAN